MPRTARFLLSLGNVFFSLVLGTVALAFCLFFFPAATLQLYKGARAVGEALLSGAWPAQYEPVLRALADERLIVYMGFVLATLGIKLEFGAQPPDVTWMVPLLVLALPLFDISLVVFTRIMEGRSPGQAGDYDLYTAGEEGATTAGTAPGRGGS